MNVVPSLLRRNPEWIEKKLVDFHVILQIPKASTHPRFAHLPELESFARTDKERRLLEIYRSFSIAGATFITPPRTPPERVRMLRDAMSAAYKDPEFVNDYKKLTGDAPSPLTPDEFDEVLKKLLGIRKMWIFLKKSQARARSRPLRFVETRLADSIGAAAARGRVCLVKVQTQA